MEICVLSGKGGTGKTFVSSNLFNVLDNSIYIDCDVEEPNGHIFFEDSSFRQYPVTKMIPEIDNEKCSACRKCIDFCRFGSLIMIMDQVYFLDEMCHSCGGCAMVCPENAIKEVPKEIGKIEERSSAGKSVYTGRLNIGEASGTGIIKELLKKGSPDRVTVVDCPPGSDCSVIESIQQADFCILVGEPTVFGIHNLDMVAELLKIFSKPFGIVSNKVFEEENMVKNYADKNRIPLLEQFFFDKELGRTNSNGILITDTIPEYRNRFSQLYEKIRELTEKDRRCAH